MKFRFHKHIDRNPDSWQNCSMLIQDLSNHQVNVTAEISEQKAANFQKYCISYHKLLLEEQKTNSASARKVAIKAAEKPKTRKQIPKEIVEADPMQTRILEEASELLLRKTDRIEWEKIILNQLDLLFKKFVSLKLKLMPIGSSTYGFGGAHTNFNILIDASLTSKASSYEWIQSIYDFFNASTCQSEFDQFKYLPKNRVLKSRLLMIHKPSKIECMLICDNFDLPRTSELIKKYMEIEPTCK